MNTFKIAPEIRKLYAAYARGNLDHQSASDCTKRVLYYTPHESLFQNENINIYTLTKNL